VVVAVSGVAAGTVLAGGAGTGAAATPKIYFGIDGTASNMPVMSKHAYGQLNGNVPVARMITMGSGGVHWSALAAAQRGSSAYTNLTRWADALKTRSGPIYLAVAHEPEAKALRSYGSSAQYAAAYRHVVTVFRSLGVTNVRWTWQMTANSFFVKSSDPRSAPTWYPGNGYVDDVAIDGYNWAGCRGGTTQQLSAIAAPALKFARANGKGLLLGEFGTGPSARSQWLQNAKAFLITNNQTIRAAYYFDHFYSASGCNWELTSSADISALKSIAADSHFSS
jgi:hypothetical protein